MASYSPLPKTQAFNFSLLSLPSVKNNVSAVYVIVRVSHIHSLQQLGNKSPFHFSLMTRAATNSMLAAGAIHFGTTSVTIAHHGHQIIQESVFWLRVFVADEALIPEVALYA